MAEVNEKPKTGWRGPAGSINKNGRPKRDPNAEKKNNKTLRSEELMSLTRKLKPHLSKAIMAAVTILDNKESADTSKLKASALIIATYRELIKDVFHKDYDEDEGEEVQENKAPVFSLRMLQTDVEEDKS